MNGTDPAADLAIDTPATDLEADSPPTFDVQQELDNEWKKAHAAITADPRDLQNYADARARGLSHEDALKLGDNGIGTWGDILATYKTPMVELPSDTDGLERGRLVQVQGPQGSTVAKIAGLMPPSDQKQGNADIHLNPAAAAAVGHPGEIVPITWRYASDPGAPAQDPSFPQPLSSKTKLSDTTGAAFSAGDDLTVVGQNSDGSYKLSNGWNKFRGGYSYRDEGNIRNIIYPNGQHEQKTVPKTPKENIRADAQGKLFDMDTGKDVTPEGFATKPKIIKDSETGLQFDVSDINNPKPITLPGNPAAVDMSTVKQGDWSSVPEEFRDVAKAIDDYRYTKLSGFVMRSPYFKQMFKLITKVDPSFDYKKYDERQKQLNDLASSGKMGQNLSSFNAALYHLNSALDSSAELAKLHDSPDTIENAQAFGEAAGRHGDPRPNKYMTDVNAVMTEMGRAVKGAAPDQADIDMWKASLGVGDPYEATGFLSKQVQRPERGGYAAMKEIPFGNSKIRNAGMDEMVGLLGGRMAALNNQYKRVMGKDPDFSFIDEDAAKTLERVGTPKAREILEKYGPTDTRPWVDPGSRSAEAASFPGAEAPTEDSKSSLEAAQRVLERDPNNEEAKQLIHALSGQ